ncbi:MAG TPA: amidohydrolase family protein [Acidimicrobiia bacterium]
MPMPTDVGAIDLMIGFPIDDRRNYYEFLKPQLHDKQSQEDFEFPAQYMFKEPPHFDQAADPIEHLVELMDHYGIAKGMVGAGRAGDQAYDAAKRYPDRFFCSLEIDANKGMDAVRSIQRAYDEVGIKAVTAFPCGMNPQVPINDKKMFPIYAKCVELDIPICCCSGVPGPRVPFDAQYVGHIDEVCWFFPELKFVTRHGCEPWAELAAKLLLKWPNLYYSTSAFAPKYYPKAIIDFANTRGADKVMYAGYFPMGLSLDRIFKELPSVPFKDDVWPKFLRHNAERVFKL